jgi:type II restriction enzyme
MNHKWIISRHTRDMDLLIEVALLIKKYQSTINEDDKIKILKELEKAKIYSPRFGDSKKSTLNSKINQLAFYMFGYKTKINGENKFLFSPLGNLLLKYREDKNKRNKIFLTMLWGLQFTHPHSQTDEEYQLYPFRLLFKLMNEVKLDKKLFISEISYFVMIQKDINLESYDQLVAKILNFRTKTTIEIAEIFLNTKSNLLVNAVYECDYYLKVIMKYFNLIKSIDGDIIVKLPQGKGSTRKVNNSYCTINEDILNYIQKLENNYSFISEPLKFTGNKHNLDITKEIYNFYPNILLSEIGEDVDYNILQLPKLIDEFSKNKDNANAYNFEDVLEQGFNTFINVDAKKIAGAGNTDIKCLYLDDESIFAVEAKSTKNKLSLINSGRLQDHRNKIGADYTIVITPRYVPAVLKDIKNTNNVIITASTFSEYLYNSILKNERNIDYKEINNLVINNLGSDISNQLSDITFNKFAVSNKI